MSYRPIANRTVYASVLFRKPEVQDAFDKIDALPDESIREGARHTLVALVSVAADIKQSIDDLSGDVARISDSLVSLTTMVEKDIAGRK